MALRLNCILFLLFSLTSHSQVIDTIFFSVTGDTVLYSPSGYGRANSDTVNHYMIVASFNKVDTIKIISRFEIMTVGEESLYRKVPSDTIIKYKLQFDGIRGYPPDNNFTIEVKPKNIKFISEKYNSEDKIYTAEIHLKIKCKNKLLRKEVIKDYNFIGRDKRDFNRIGVCYLTFWKKFGKEKYLIFYSVSRGVKIRSSQFEEETAIKSILSYADYY